MATGGSSSSESLKRATRIRKCMVKLSDRLPSGNSKFLLECVSEGILTHGEQEQIHREQDGTQKATMLMGFVIKCTLNDGESYDSFLELLREYKLQDLAAIIKKTAVTQRDLDITKRSYQTV